MENIKRCAKCKEEKTFDCFAAEKKAKNGLSSYCRPCWSKRVNQWQQENKEKVREKRLRFDYGITVEQFNAMFTSQAGCCAICKVHQSSLPRALCIDHDHTSGEIRGLLCDNCNRGIGCLQDSRANLKAADAYLASHEQPKLAIVEPE